MKKIFYIMLLISFSLQLTFAQDLRKSNSGPVPKSKYEQAESLFEKNQNAETIGYAYASVTEYTLSIPATCGFSLLTPWSFWGYLSSMCMGGDGNYYATYDYGPSLYQLDTLNGAWILLGNITGILIGETPNGIAYNTSNGTYYICTGSALYSFDVTTRVAQYIGPFNTGGIMIDLCFDANGICYAYDIGTDNAYKINISTGSVTLLGPLGYYANYGQGMSYDYQTNTIYLSAFNSSTNSGQCRIMDPVTGMTTLITDWGFEQIDAFALAYSPAVLCPVESASNPDPPNGATNVPNFGRTLHWTNGAGTTNVELWFGPVGNVVKVYDGPAITSYALPTLFFGTTFLWQIVCKNDTCSTWGPTWSFTTMQDPILTYVTINVYPQNMNYWTGTCSSSAKTQFSLVNAISTELGWMVFDLNSIVHTPAIVIDEIVFNGYLYSNNWPYWAITSMGSVDPRTGTASEIYNQISNNYQQGMAYSFNQESGTLTNGWVQRTLGGTANEDMKNSLAQDWFAIGIVEWDFSTSYHVWFQGWAEANEPYLTVTYAYCLSCLPPNPPSNFTTQVIFNPSPNVQLNWQDNSSNEYGFKIYRKNGYPNDPRDYIIIGTTFSNVNQFIDTSVLPESTYTYRVYSFDAFFQSGSDTVTVTVSVPVGIEEILNDELPQKFSLYQNYPNPFNPNTVISYQLPVTGNVTLKVYDMLGNEVATLVNEEQPPGKYEIEFSTSSGIRNLVSGIYFYQLKAGSFIETKKMILLK